MKYALNMCHTASKQIMHVIEKVLSECGTCLYMDRDSDLSFVCKMFCMLNNARLALHHILAFYCMICLPFIARYLCL